MDNEYSMKNERLWAEVIQRAGHLPAAEVAGEVCKAMARHESLVVTAPPGAGKSTLLPLAMLADSPGQGRILMLEPRRLAARQIAERMAALLGEPVGKTVGYRVRFDQRVSGDTRVEVVTEGILTRMLVGDATLDGVDTVIFDEFHERSLNSDLALALTRQAQQLIRPDLRIVVMSATIDADDICRMLHAPLVESQGRMFPVREIHDTEDLDARDMARRVAAEVSKAHREQEGDILVFLPGRAEIQAVADLLSDSLSPTEVYPLYGHLSPERQRKAIAPSAEGERKVVLATSIAETSLTIEGVRVVVDTGWHRTPVFDARSGLNRLATVRISRDMATQRMGRAGRVAPGVCYRMWPPSSAHFMADRRHPEIIDADLAPMVLEVAAFGESDVMALPWLTPPPSSAVAQAYGLLRSLGAVDGQCRVTALGRKMAAMPCHPRISRMILGAATAKQKRLACDVAALMEEKDPMADSAGTDMAERVSALRSSRRKGTPGRWTRMAQIADEYLRMARLQADNDDVAPADVGTLVAYAYPERIAMSIDAAGDFRLAGGGQVRLERTDPLSAYPWIAVASLNGAAGTVGRVFLAAPLNLSDLDDSMFIERDNVSWDDKRGRVVMQRERRVGRLIADSRPLHDADHSAVVTAVCEAVRKGGLGLLDWNDDVRRLQLRVAQVAEWHPELELPDISTSRILATVSDWLPFYLEQGGRIAATAADLKKISLCEVLWALVPYDLQQEVDRLAPTHATVPTGSRIRIDYRLGAEAPVLSVRLQECFGMERTPCVDGGTRPLLMELLSPGFKPVQLTQDLTSFWRTTYFEVRKELKRRYPKHYWPENPLDAEAVRGVKRKG